MFQWMLAIWSLFPLPFFSFFFFPSAFSKSSLSIWKFSVHVLLKPSLKDFEHYLASTWNECNCAAVWTFFGIALYWDWNELTFSSPVATAEFFKFVGILSVVLSQHHLLGFEIAQLDSITSTSFEEATISSSIELPSRWPTNLRTVIDKEVPILLPKF